MTLFKKVASCGLSLIIASMLAGCASHPRAESWNLPNKKSANLGIIIGRLDLSGNKTENPDGETLDLYDVAFRKKGEWYPMNGFAEDIILDNHYFVVPNLEPGKYYLYGFFEGNTFNSVQDESSLGDKDFIEVKPGDIKFVGSMDYVKHDRSFLEKVKSTGTFHLKRASHPTELEMLQWLRRVGKGSGWEQTINKKIRELGGQ